MKHNGTINRRILLGFLGVLVVTFIVTTIVFTFVSKQFVISQTRKDLNTAGSVIEKNLLQTIARTENSETPDKIRLARLIADIGVFESYMEMETIVINDEEAIIYPKQNWTIERLNQIKKRLRLTDTDYIYFEYEIQDTRLPISKLVLLKRYENVKTIRNIGFRSFVVSFSIGGLLAIIFSIFFSRRIYKPIRRLSFSMTEYIRNRTPVEVYHSNDEIEELSYNFKSLTDKISKLDERQKQFFQNSSHELKTPLMSIQGYAEAIKDGVVSGEEIENSLDVIISETQRLKYIVDDVIYLSKIDDMIDEFKFEKHALNPIIQDAIGVVKPLLNVNNISIECHCDSTIEYNCDRDKMKRVFINLISNGSRYAKSKIIINVNQYEQRITIDVIDDGKGFDFGQEEKVFDRFYNGKKGGSGIGLALTKEIIEKHHGTIEAINNMNYGAVFKIKF